MIIKLYVNGRMHSGIDEDERYAIMRSPEPYIPAGTIIDRVVYKPGSLVNLVTKPAGPSGTDPTPDTRAAGANGPTEPV
jgi:hypothetical protein